MSGGKSSEQTVGYKYYAGVLFKLGFGPFDKIIKLTYADRVAWKCEEAGKENGFGRINVNKPSLLGGDSREGGISGAIDVGMGYPEQPTNGYLQARMGAGDGGALVPAYRDVVTLIARQVYWGNNPYLKPLAMQCQRIHKTHEGATQWYNDKSAIGGFFSEGASIFISMDASWSMDYVEGNGESRLQNAKDEIELFLDFVKSKISANSNVSVAFCAWNATRTTTVKNNASASDIDDLISTVQSVTTAKYTDFEQAVLDAPDFFSNKDTCGRTLLFITDGLPAASGETAAQTAQDAADVLSGITNLDSYGVNIALSDTTYTAYLDNTSEDGVPVIANGGNGQLTSILKYSTTQGADINPAHFIREIHTNPVWGGAFPDSEMGSTYNTVADTLYDEGLGVSFYFSEELSYGEMVDEVSRTIDAVTYLNRSTLQHEIKLIRPDYDPETLTVFDESNSRLGDYSQTPDSELFNQIVLKYLDEEANNWVSLTFQDVAAIELAGGHVISKTIEYAGISNADVATMVGQRDLQRYSRPYLRGSNFKIHRKALNLNPGDPFKLQSAKQGLDIVGRVVKLHPHKWLTSWVEIDWVEDIYSSSYNVYTPPSITQWTDPNGITATDFSVQTAFEVPYFLQVKRLGDTGIEYLPADSCFYGMAGGRPPSGLHLSYNLFTYTDGLSPVTDEEEAYTCQFTPYATVSEDVSDPAETIIPITPVNDPETVKVGNLVLIGNDVDNQREIVAIAATLSDGDTTLTIDRGVADTVPKPMQAGTVLYIIGDHYGFSDTEYLAGETIEGYGIPQTGRDAFSGPFTYHDVDMNDRQALPYPPANFKVDGHVMPFGYNPPADTVTLTWRYRDRALQSDQVISWFEDADYGPEAGTTYRVESDAYDVDGTLISANWLSINVGLVKTYNLDTSTAPANTAVIDVRVWAVRDGLDSLQAAEVSLLLGSELLLTVDGEPLIITDNEYILTGS